MNHSKESHSRASSNSVIEIGEEPISTIAEQAKVSMIFQYDRIYDLTVADNGFGGFVLTEKILDETRAKDYDDIEEDRPTEWPKRFDVKNWGFIVARSEGKRIGGAVIAHNCPQAHMIDRPDQAVLWDLRIAPEFRQSGVGHWLFTAVENWAKARGCDQLKIETQNNNVAACKFYQRQGCELGGINRFAYPPQMNEIQMLWYKKLGR